MKAETIVILKNLLETAATAARIEHRNYRTSLENKYKTEWLDKVISVDETVVLRELANKRTTLGEALDDFLQHQF